MGSAESKVAAQPPLAVVTSPSAGRDQKPVVLCNFLRKQNKTAPATVTPSPPQTPISSPTVEAVKDAKKPSATSTTDTSVTSGAGPSVQLTTRALSLHNLGNDELSMQLLKAVKNGDQKLVERIAEIATTKQQSIINIRGMWESTPLIYACQYCHEPIALWLLRAGANVHLANEKGVTALLLASLEGMTAAVQQILLQLTDTTGNTEERIPIDAQVGVVYNSLADMNVRVSPLLGASMNGHVEVVRLLLQHGAKVNNGVSTTGAKPAPSGSGGARGGEGGNGALQFPLLLAAKYGHSAVVQLLIKNGADIRETDGNENHALLLACEASKEECALTLLRHLPVAEHGAWKRANCHGFTALHYCAVNGLVKAAECMLRQLQWSSDTEFLNATSSTRHECAVLMASRKKQVEVAKLLIQCDADLKLADRGGTTALDVLKRDKRDEVVLMWEEHQRQRHQEAASKVQDEVRTGTEEVSPPPEMKMETHVNNSDDNQPSESILEEPAKEMATEMDESKPDAFESEGGQADMALPVVEDPDQTVPVPHPQDTLSVEGTDTRLSRADSLPVSDTASVEAMDATKSPDPIELAQPVVALALASSPVNTSDGSAASEMAPSKVEDVSASDDSSHSATSTVVDTLVEGSAEELSATEDGEPSPATALAPHRPLSSRSKSGSSKKINNRRGTGHVSQDISSAKRLGSRIGTMSAIPMGAEEGEEDHDGPSEGRQILESATQPAAVTPMPLPWEDTTPIFTGPALGSLEVSSPATVEMRANDRTTSSRSMTSSREVARVETVAPAVRDVEPVEDRAATSEDASPPATTSSPSPRKEREKSKKKKKHSRKKAADANETLVKEETVSPSLESASTQQPDEDEVRFVSVRVQPQDEGDNGALDDDF